MCTTICFKKENQIIVGNNEDTFILNGMIFTNHRGLKKVALLAPSEKPYDWISKYGSISFSQFGKEFPSSGINERGLVVEQMQLPETEYPMQDGRKTVKDLQWIQMILDTCQTSEEAAQITIELRLTQTTWPAHFLICDATGDFRIMEYLNGNIHIYGQTGDRVPVLTNSKYIDSIDYMKGKKVASEIKEPYLFNSIERFVKASVLTSKVSEFISKPSSSCFDILSQVATENTVWSFAYNLSNPTLYIKDFFNHSKKTIELREIDFSANASWKLMELTSKKDILDEITFQDYSFNLNHKLVETNFHNQYVAEYLGYHIPYEALMRFSLYPESVLKLKE